VSRTAGGQQLSILIAMSDPVESVIEERRTALEEEADLLRAKVHELDAKEDDLSYDDNFADSAQVAAERGENKVLYDQLRRDLDDIEKALVRMDDGTYGTCEVCGAEIGEARLEVMPSTRFCIDHA
jgi:DnaK suppressor protein